MTQLLQLVANDVDSTTVSISDGEVATGWKWLSPGAWADILGDVVVTPLMASSIDTEGPTKTGQRLDARQVGLSLQADAASTSALVGVLQTMRRQVESINKRGGWLVFRGKNLQRKTKFRVLHVDVQGSWSHAAEAGTTHRVNLVLTCSPYGYLDPYGIRDRFTSDTRPDYTFDASSSSTLAIASSMLTPSGSLGVERRLVHTVNGHTFPDAQAQIRTRIGALVTGFKAGVIVKRVDAANYVVAYIDDDGANSRLRIDVVVAGATTNVASTNLAARLNTTTAYFVRARIVGNAIYACLALATKGLAQPSEPLLFTAETSPIQAVLTSSQRVALGATVPGAAGIAWTPQHASDTLTDFRVWPYTSGGHSQNITRTPDVVQVRGVLGDAPAEVQIEYGHPTGPHSSGVLFAAWERPEPHNELDDWSCENSYTMWSVAAIAGMTSAATSVTQSSADAYTGDYCLEVVTPATSGSGVARRLDSRFRAGEPVTAKIRLKAPASTTAMVLQLGTSASSASSTATALTADWVEHTVTWTPAADTDVAWLCIKTNAATATTFRFDQIVLYRGDAPPASPVGGRFPLGVLSANWHDSTDHVGTVVANARYRLGYGVESAAGGNLQLRVPLRPYLARNEATDGTLFISAYLMFYSSATATPAITASMEASMSGGMGVIYPVEFPNGAVAPTSFSSNMNIVRLGTFAVPVDLDCIWDLKVVFTGQGAVIFGADSLILAPSLNTATLGVSNSAYQHAYKSRLSPDLSVSRLAHHSLSAGDNWETEQGYKMCMLGGARILLKGSADSEVLHMLSTFAPPASTTNTSQTFIGVEPIARVAIAEAD